MSQGEQFVDADKLTWVTRVFANSRNGIIVTDANANIIDINPTFTAITGYSRDEVIGRNPRLLHSGLHDEGFYTSMWSALRKEGAWQGEISNRRKNGEIIVELLSINAVHDDRGQITHYVGSFSNLTHFKAYQDQLEQMAHYDALTRLPNRVLLCDRLRQAIAWVERQGTLVAVCYMDLNGFKPVNDLHGHQAGDNVLVELAERLRASVREGDTVARIGGDEFVLLLHDVDSLNEIDGILSRLLEEISTPMACVPGLSLSASIGVALYPMDNVEPEQLLVHADKAMYAVKQSGKPGYHVFDPERDHQIREYREDIALLRQALNDGEFVLFFQPIVNVSTGDPVGLEALMRWNHPERGLLLPEDFLPGRQPGREAGAIAMELDLWAIEATLQQIVMWGSDFPVAHVSVNISMTLLHWPEFPKRLAGLLANYPVGGRLHLELEITESSALADLMLTSRVIEQCGQLGVGFALDDFGTGYAALGYLKHLSAGTLKIDGVFIANMLHDPGDMAVVESIIGMGRAFGRSVVAEGVERQEQVAALCERGCTTLQGYGIARPMPPDDVTAWAAGMGPSNRPAAPRERAQ